MSCLLPRPGDITATYMYDDIEALAMHPGLRSSGTHPEFDNYDSFIVSSRNDGLLFVIAHVGDWCFVLTSKTMRLG